MGRLFTPARLLVAGFVLAVAVAAVLIFAPSSSYIFLPDPAHPVAPLVTVEGEKPDKNGGGVFFVDVIVREATLIERLVPEIHEGASIVPASAIRRPGESDQERRRGDARAMQQSQSIAAAVALRALGYTVKAHPLGVRIEAVDPTLPAAKALEDGQVIVAVDGRPIRDPADLRNAITAHEIGDTVRLDVRDGKRLRKVTLKTVEDKSRPGTPIIGIAPGQAVDITLPLEVKIDAGNVGGPSAGLAFALDLMEELGRNVDRGHKVAATGSLELDGTVGAIGGIKQKTIGARRAGIDVFLVPGENAAEARRHADGLRVVAVDSFRQALRELATLPEMS